MIYGTIFGDISGSTHEYRPVQNYDFELIEDDSHFTDDTVMTIAVANWLLQDRSKETLIKEMQIIGQKYPQAGYGGTFRMWLVDADPQPYNS